MKERLMNYWQQLNEREQLLVLIAALFLALAVIYFGWYHPLRQATQSAQRQLLDARSTLAWMQQVEPFLEKKQAPQQLSGPKLLSVLSASLMQTACRAFPSHLEQATAKRIQLTFDEVPYVPLMSWLNAMSARYAFTIEQLQVNRSKNRGMVKLLLIISVP